MGRRRDRRADPGLTHGAAALLLERLHPEDLADLWDLEACEIVAASYRRLHVPALPLSLRTLSSYVATWTDGRRRCRPGPRSRPGLVQQAVAIGRTFAADPECDGRIIHGDLHYENAVQKGSAEQSPPCVSNDDASYCLGAFGGLAVPGIVPVPALPGAVAPAPVRAGALVVVPVLVEPA